MNRDIDVSERGAHVVHLSGVVSDAARLRQQRFCRRPVKTCRRCGGSSQVQGAVDAELLGR